ncbi:TylF/MycF/NovP-related O-methyltransferase [Demequina sp. NBRC 110057]|uniref:TylF/MycF/NovP-related O-methyltransferase n=1 Tax=Demequina sp. NBRC 110057 TaxID=1570346 RepID=UPI0009FD832B|nr:TylF/MycF/NovP-related O-methyltransferase [Demequina sp. NBRC 110057]
MAPTRPTELPSQAWAFARMPAIARTVVRERLTYLSPVKLRRLHEALDEADARGVPGAIVEFGIALGGSATALASRRGGRHFHGFDVFGQIPAPNEAKDGERAVRRYEVIAAGKSEGIRGDAYYGYMTDLQRRVTDTMRAHGVDVDGDTVALHRGLFDESWPTVQERIPTIALAHIDCDWHDPVAFCLDAIAERVSPGGIVVLDDYLDYEGCRTAVDEFLAAHPEFECRHLEGNLSLRRR